MAILVTGPIENSAVSGIRPTQQVTVKIINRDVVNTATVLIQGYMLNGTRNLYVSETLLLAANGVLTRNYFANLDAFEYIFTTGGAAEAQVEISFWGKQASGQLVDAHRIVVEELE